MSVAWGKNFQSVYLSEANEMKDKSEINYFFLCIFIFLGLSPTLLFDYVFDQVSKSNRSG